MGSTPVRKASFETKGAGAVAVDHLAKDVAVYDKSNHRHVSVELAKYATTSKKKKKLFEDAALGAGCRVRKLAVPSECRNTASWCSVSLAGRTVCVSNNLASQQSLCSGEPTPARAEFVLKAGFPSQGGFA